MTHFLAASMAFLVAMLYAYADVGIYGMFGAVLYLLFMQNYRLHEIKEKIKNKY